MVLNICSLMRSKSGINEVALSGGVFQNRLLLGMVLSALRPDGFNVYTHKRVPCNDGGISLGQAAIALSSL
jgi:hydrogenase maturation protein HypF